MDTGEEKTMFEITEMQEIMLHFGVSVQSITNFYDTSRNDEDKRLNYILDGKYVLKINSVGVMWEEYAIYPVLGWGTEHDRREVIEHLGVLASKYSGIDLSETKSMWSIIDLAPLDIDIDEKQENTNILTEELRKSGYNELAAEVQNFNAMLRKKIMVVFEKLPRCV